MSAYRADLITVFHNATNRAQSQTLAAAIARYEPDGGFRFLAIDNTVNNRGFAAGCNLGAFHPQADAPIIGFINPDAHVEGPFLDKVRSTLHAETVVTGCRYGKSQQELKTWGLTDWVCGAAMFVDREWFTAVGGFDTQFVWGWDDTDLCHQAEAQGRVVRSIRLPLRHESPSDNSPEDVVYKNHHFHRGAQRYHSKWASQPARR